MKDKYNKSKTYKKDKEKQRKNTLNRAKKKKTI